jgi:hypothetical protein
MQNTALQYDEVIFSCKDIFEKKTKDYGTAWRILRTSSLTDQIFIKANRIRTIQETGENKVGEDIRSEFIGIINYCIIALIQLELGKDARMDIPVEETMRYYAHYASAAKSLMETKNHDYGEAWRDMRISSLTYLILIKILRVKQIEDYSGKTLISEGIDANYFDMVNYSVFALILMNESEL